jgi:hypothetical protein
MSEWVEVSLEPKAQPTAEIPTKQCGIDGYDEMIDTFE